MIYISSKEKSTLSSSKKNATPLELSKCYTNFLTQSSVPGPQILSASTPFQFPLIILNIVHCFSPLLVEKWLLAPTIHRGHLSICHLLVKNSMLPISSFESNEIAIHLAQLENSQPSETFHSNSLVTLTTNPNPVIYGNIFILNFISIFHIFLPSVQGFTISSLCAKPVSCSSQQPCTNPFFILLT